MESDFTWTGEPPVIWDTLAKAEKERDEWKIRATEWLAVNELCARRVHAAEKRVAELEARLADQEWRPVTGEEPALDKNILLLTYYPIGEPCIARREYHDGNNNAWRRSDGYLFSIDDLLMARWRPLPPPPAATE